MNLFTPNPLDLQPLETLRAWLRGRGKQFIKPPVPRFVGFDERLRIKSKARKKKDANVVRIPKKKEAAR